jgi:hypothetical protein
MKSILAICLLVALAATTFGQDITGSIVGTVLDASGAGVPNAKVTVTNTDRNVVVRTLTTDNDGNYTATLLDVGHYSVTVEAKGFKRATEKDINLNVKDQLTVGLKLEVGDVQQEVTVEAGPVQVQLQSGGEQSTTVNGTQIRELALITRNYEQLVGLMPGVSSSSVDQLYVGVSVPAGTVSTIPFAINGARNSGSAWMVDGADNIDRGSNLTLLTTPSIDAIDEFKVARSGYGADMGRAGGGQISVITKSGTNQFHGDAYEFVRNNDFAANNFYNNATSLNLGADGKSHVAPLHYNNFGWTLGGPIVIPKLYDARKVSKHQTYFFFSEEFRRVITYTSGTAVVPSTSMINGVFPTPVCVQSTGGTCNQTATTIANIDPVAKEYIKDIFSRIPLPASGSSLVTLFRNVFNFEQELYKIDHTFSPKLQLSARFQRDQIPTEEPMGLFLALPIPGVGNTSTNAPGHTWVVRGISSLSPTWLNEAGYNFSYGAIISNPTGSINSTASPDILTTLPFAVTLGRVPSLSFLSGTGITGYGPYRDYNRNHNIYDNVTKVIGRHTVKFGATYNHYQKTENNAGANAGSFNFTPAVVPTGTTSFTQAFANFLLGNVASFSQASEDVTPNIHAQQFEMYVQDDWRLMPNLTVNIGVRYSNFRQPTDANHQLTSFDPALYNAANAPQLTAGGLLANISANSYLNGIIIGGKNSPFGQAVSGADNSDFAPRFGFAWDPFRTGKTSIRGGYGMFYDATLYGTFEQNIFANPPFVNNVTISNVTLDNPAGGTANVANSPKNLTSTPINFKTPYNQQWSLEVQRQIMKDTILNVSYVGSKGTHLIGTLDLNELPPGLAYSSGLIAPTTPITSANTPSLNALRPYLGYAAFGQGIEPWFNSNYNSLQVYGQKRFSALTMVTFAYTWARNLTDNQSDRSNAAQNTYNFNRGEYGPALYDRTQVFNANFIYLLPFYKQQQGLVGKSLGGWEVSGIANYYTGLPYTATTSATDPGGLGIIGNSGASLRPNLTCNPNSGFTFSRLEGFNTSCFQAPPVAAHLPGNEGRGVIRGPGYEGWGFSVSKNVLFGEAQRYRFQLRGEASNVFNHTNPSTFGSLSILSTLFGQFTGYRDPRIIQIGAKLYF